MDLEHTNNLAMPLLIPNQSGKEITHNEALVILDNIVQKSVVDKDLSTPPENPENNVLYIVGQNAIDEWENKENYLTYFDNGWRFITPKNGFVFFVEDENKLYNFNGTSWVEIAPNFTPSITSLQNISHVGINATADSTNKLTVKSDSVLFDNATANSTVKINKNTESNTASITLQSDNTSKAEFGLITNDNLTLKVSSDGENWNNAFVVDKATGNIDFKGTITNNGKAIISNSESSFISPLKFVSTSAFKSLATNIKFDENTNISFPEITKTLTSFTEGNNNGSFILLDNYIYDWTQPIITSDSENGITITASSYNNTYYPYKAMDGSKTGTENNCFILNSTTGWWKVNLEYNILINEIKLYNNYTTGTNRTKSFQIWTDESKTTALSEIITLSNTNFAETTITLETPILTNSIYIEILSCYGNCSGIGEIEITAKTNDYTKSNIFNNWLNVYAITNDNATKKDICCYFNNQTLTLPTDFTKSKLIGWIYVDNNLEIEKFYIIDNKYYFNTQKFDANNITITSSTTNVRLKTPLSNTRIFGYINVNYGNVTPNLNIISSDFDDTTPTEVDKKPYGGFVNYEVPVGLDGKIKLVSSTSLSNVNISTNHFVYSL